jgi:hypothetical protein
MYKIFSSYMRVDGKDTIIPRDEPGRRDKDYYEGKFSSHVYPVKHPLKNGCDKNESRELMCPI